MGEVTEIKDSSREGDAGQDLWEQGRAESASEKGGAVLPQVQFTP